MVGNRVRSTIGHLSNFSFDHEGDRELYERIEEGLQLRVHRENLIRILVEEVILSSTYRELREAYLRLSKDLCLTTIAVAEMGALVDVLDLKCSQLARALEETERHAGDSRLELLSEFFARKGVTTNHRLWCEQQENQRPRLKLVK